MNQPDFPYYLGPYKVVAELGAGGFATVYRAIVEGEMGFSRQVALKVLHPHITRSNRSVVKMLADEALLLARMQHPNVVYVQWFGQLDHPTEGKVFAMMMEYVPGRTLREIQEEVRLIDRLPLSVVLDIHLDILKGLRFAHEITGDDGKELNLVHRDLKPDNVMISQEGAVKLLDFGIAMASERLVDATETDMVRGTVHYMSPEQVRGQDLDFRSDLFAFGAMLYQGLTGKRMIGGSTLISAMHRVAAFNADIIAEPVGAVLPAAVPVLRKFVAQNREDRFGSTAEALTAMRQLRDVVPSSEVSSVFLSRKVRAVSSAAAIADTSDISVLGSDDVSGLPPLTGATPPGSQPGAPKVVVPESKPTAPPRPPAAAPSARDPDATVPMGVGPTRPQPAVRSNRLGPLVFALGAVLVVFGAFSLLRSKDVGSPADPVPEVVA
ncbi:MAG: serine/threonine protein kinase, partial [Deltaproteobacteria bacterium]|nr:serine/threonine protein kinase [Deltaproteobacteria bacterium]